MSLTEKKKNGFYVSVKISFYRNRHRDNASPIPGDIQLKKTTCFFIFFVMLFSHGQSAWGSEQAFAVYREGLALERAVNIFLAIDKHREAIRLEPTNKGFLEHYAWLLHNYEFQEEAIEAFVALQSHEKNPEVLYRGFGWNEKAIGRLPAFVSYFDKVYRLTSPLGDFNQVIPEIQINSARENDKKIAEVRKKLDKDPNNVELLKELFQLYVYQGEWKNATSTGDQVLKISRTDLPFRFSYARMLFWSGQQKGAVVVLQGLIGDSPDNAYLYYYLGKVQSAMGQLDDAKHSLQKSLSFYPGAVKTRKELSEVLARQGKGEEGVAMALAMNKGNKVSLEARLALARSYQYSGRLGKAIPVYEQILARYPFNEDALQGISDALIKTGRYAEAKKTLATWKSFPGNSFEVKRLQEVLGSIISPVVGLAADYYGNSSDFERFNAGAYAKMYAGWGVSPKFGAYYSQFNQIGFKSINRQSVFLEADKKINDLFTLKGRTDVNSYSNDQQNLNGKIALDIHPLKGTTIGLSYEHIDIIDTKEVFGNPIYNYVTTIGAVGSKIITDDISASISQSFGRLSLWGEITYGSYSDKNEKLTYVIDVGYQLFQTPKVRLDYSYFYLDYKNPSPNYIEDGKSIAAYYDPINLDVHTVSIEIEQQLFSSFWFQIKESVSYIPKSHGIANTIFGSIIYKFTPVDSLSLTGRYFYQNEGVPREGQDGYFRAQNVMISYEHRF